MKYYIILLILTYSVTGFSQTKFKHKVIIYSDGISNQQKKNQTEKDLGNYQIYKTHNYDGIDTIKLKKGYELTITSEKNYNGKKYLQEKDSLIIDNSYLTFKTKKTKKEKLNLEKGEYDANLSISKDTILINFWLLTEKGKTYYTADNLEKKSFQLNPETKYYIKLKNRQYVSFFYSNYEIAALTIPFKYRFGNKKNDLCIDPEFNTEINISTFLGKRIGRVTYTYDTYKGMVERDWSVTLGGFFGLSSVKLDSISTSSSKMPLNKEFNAPALSYGIGAVFNISDFNLGLFYGCDNALGKNGDKWNFDNQHWLGIGLGYKLIFLGAQE